MPESWKNYDYEVNSGISLSWNPWNCPKNMEKNIWTIQVKALLRSARILRRILESRVGLLSLGLVTLYYKPDETSHYGCEKIKNNKNNNDNTRQGIKKNKLWNMKVTIIPIVIGAFGTVTLNGLSTVYLRDWRTWKSKGKWRPSKLQHC